MIISRTPYRVSLFGGGTDYPAWYLKEGGAVLSTAIDKYCYITCRYLPPFFENKHRIVWSHIETVTTISEILHPAVREALRFLGFDDSVGVEIHHQGDLPARSGIGSSSSFSVGLIKALTGLRGRMIGKHELALRAIELEQQVLHENVGSQDQVAAAYGGLNTIHFLQSGSIQVEPIIISDQRTRDLAARLLLLYTGQSRMGGEIAATVISKLAEKDAELRRLREILDRAVTVLVGSDSLDGIGELLHESWMTKRSLAAGVTSPEVDAIYATARQQGALGGKLLGAGSKGFMLFYVPPEKTETVMRALSRYLWVPFGYDWEGSTTIYYDSPNSRTSH